MTITLKKALKARKELEALINSIKLPTSARLSVFVKDTLTAPLAAVESETKALRDKIDEKLRASAVLANLRKAIGAANAEHGVEDLLAEQAHVDRSIATWKEIAGADPTAAEEVLKGELNLAAKLLEKEAPAPRIAYHAVPEKAVAVSTVPVSFKEQAEAEILRLRRRKEEIEDQRVAVNAGQRIEIAEDDLKFLRERGIV